MGNKQNKKHLQLPITARQAHKILSSFDESDQHKMLVFKLASVLKIDRKSVTKDKVMPGLSKLSQLAPNTIVWEQIAPQKSGFPTFSSPDDEDYEDWEFDNIPDDFDYTDDDVDPYGDEDDADNAEPQYAPKKTNEIAPQSDNPSDDSDCHGGDNASQEVEDGQSQGGDQQSSSGDSAQSQSTGTDEGMDGNGSGSGQMPSQSYPGSDPTESDGSESGGNSTSEGAATGGNRGTLARQTARSSESEADSELGEDTATSPMSDTDVTIMQPSSDRDSRRNQSQDVVQNESDSIENGEGDDFNQPRQDDNSELGNGHQHQGQPEANKDSQSFVADDENDWDGNIPNLGELSDAKSDPTENGSDIPQHQKKWGKSFSKTEKEGSTLSQDANTNFGGINSSLEKIGLSPKLAKECQRKLARLVGDSTFAPSPRRDYQGFCERIKTYRNPNPARKEESGRPTILIMADVSGSCASFSDESVAVAKAASRLGVQGSDIIVLTHSNGYPVELEHNGKKLELNAIGVRAKREHDHENQAWYEGLVAKFDIAVAIALGDWDAADDYLRIALLPVCERFIWLDNAHCTSRGFVKNETKWALSWIVDKGILKSAEVAKIRHKLTYKTGCKDALAFIKEIE